MYSGFLFYGFIQSRHIEATFWVCIEKTQVIQFRNFICHQQLVKGVPEFCEQFLLSLLCPVKFCDNQFTTLNFIKTFCKVENL